MVRTEAGYFDGESAARHEVVLSFEPAGVRIDGLPSYLLWRYDDIRHATPDADARPAAFRSAGKGQEGARLVVDDPAVAARLASYCPDLADRRGRQQRRTRTALLSAAGVLAVALLAVATIHYLPRMIAPLIPVAWEKALGDRVVEDIAMLFGGLKKGGAKRCEAAPGRAALNRLARRLTGRARLPYPVTVLVLDIGMVNALATPGGNIVVFRGLLKQAQSPEEVAGVLAHELGHVVARHPAQSAARSLGVSLVFDMLLGGFGGGAAGSFGQAMLSSAYSRDAEREADAIGTDLLRKARISTTGFVAFFERLAKQSGSMEQALAFLSSHPPSAERAANARAKGPANPTPALSGAEWQALKAICGK